MVNDNIKLTRFKDDKNKKPDPIVELDSVDTKNLILRSARKLKNDDQFNRVYSTSTLTSRNRKRL